MILPPVNFLSPGHFGNMNQTFNAFFKFNKCTIRHQINNTAFYAAANCLYCNADTCSSDCAPACPIEPVNP